jgi:hypothetical protein
MGGVPHRSNTGLRHQAEVTLNGVLITLTTSCTGQQPKMLFWLFLKLVCMALKQFCSGRWVTVLLLLLDHPAQAL